MKPKPLNNGAGAQCLLVKGERMVMLAEKEFDRLMRKADEWEPLLPQRNADGTWPAVEYGRVSLARKIIRHRRRLGLAQAELARRAGIASKTLHRIEQGKRTPSAATIAKIERALENAMGAK